jgi:hypothetical protein
MYVQRTGWKMVENYAGSRQTLTEVGSKVDGMRGIVLYYMSALLIT